MALEYYKQWLTLPEVAQELGVSYTSVRAWANRRENPLPTWLPEGNRKQRKVKREELNAWIESTWRRCA